MKLTSKIRALGEVGELAQFLQQSPGIIGVLRGPEHVIEFCNEGCHGMTGGRQLVGHAAREALPELQGQGFFRLLDKVFATGQHSVARNLVVHLENAPREECVVDFMCEPVTGETGEVTGIFVQGYDVTEHARTEAELRTSEAIARDQLAQLDALYKDAPVGLALFSPEMRFVRVNERLAQMSGLAAAAHIGRTADEILPGAASAAWAQLWRVFQTGSAVSGHELRGRISAAPEKERVWLGDFYPVKHPDGSVAYVGLIVREVTDEVQAREALRRSEERFRVAQELSLDSFTILEAIRDSGHRIVDFERLYANPAAARLLTLPVEELIGQRLLSALPDSSFVRDLFDRYVKVVETGEPHDIELHYETVGTCRWFRNMAVRLGDGVAVSFSDITQRKLSEERLRLLAQEMDHRVKNLLGLVRAIVQMTEADTVTAFKTALIGRIGALGRVETLPTATGWRGAALHDIIRDELRPYNGRERVEIAGPVVRLQRNVAQTVAMVLHELATNAAKYGALSTPHGKLKIEWQTGSGLVLHWIESGLGGIGMPKRRGFGTRMIEQSIEQQLKGSVRLDWTPGGLACELTVPPGLLLE
jgi:PAS domain S-box-containing protein